jgi:hypothetical protein
MFTTWLCLSVILPAMLFLDEFRLFTNHQRGGWQILSLASPTGNIAWRRQGATSRSKHEPETFVVQF